METLKKIFTNKEVLKKIGFTLLAFLVFKLLCSGILSQLFTIATNTFLLAGMYS